MQLTRQDSTDIYPAGSMYIVAPYEPHSPAYLDKFDIVSLCVDKKLFSKMSRLSLIANCLRYAHYLLEQNWLSQDTIKGFLDGINSIYDANSDAHKASIAQPTILEYLKTVNTKQMFHEDSPLSRFHFIRKFKNETGITPHQYVVQSRIREVKKLLTNGTPIADAAALAGFCDQSHLNRWFNRSIGITPQLYKKSCFFWEG